MNRIISFATIVMMSAIIASCSSSQSPEELAYEQLDLAKQEVEIENTPLFGDYISWKNIYNGANRKIGEWFYGKENEVAPYGYRYDEKNRKYSKEKVKEMREKVKEFRVVRRAAEKIIDSLHMEKIKEFDGQALDVTIKYDTNKYVEPGAVFSYTFETLANVPQLTLYVSVDYKNPNSWQTPVLLVLDVNGKVLKRCFGKKGLSNNGPYAHYEFHIVDEVKDAVSFEIK